MSNDGLTWKDWLAIGGLVLTAIQCLDLLRGWLLRRKRRGPDRSDTAFLLPLLRFLSQLPLGVGGSIVGILALMGLIGCSLVLPDHETTPGTLEDMSGVLVFVLGIACAATFEFLLLRRLALKFPIFIQEENEWWAKPILSIIATALFAFYLVEIMGRGSWDISPLWWQRAIAVAGFPLQLGWVFHFVLDILAPLEHFFRSKKSTSPNQAAPADQKAPLSGR
jgi:hypothetical protein